MNEKLILTDIDGVFLRWDTAFTKWMSSKKFKVAVPDVYTLLNPLIIGSKWILSIKVYFLFLNFKLISEPSIFLIICGV